MAERSLEERIKRLEDVQEIQNLVGKRQFYHAAGLHDEAEELFAMKTPGVSLEIAETGKWEGPEAIKRATELHKYTWGDSVGEMAVHTLTTPVIEVAGDGKTAKAVWISPGVRTTKHAETGDFEAYWAWLKYGCDFVKEDGKWKIWHSHAYGILRAPYNMSWVEAEKQVVTAPYAPPPQELMPNRPGTPDYAYSTTTAPKLVPVPPEPYEKFDETHAY